MFQKWTFIILEHRGNDCRIIDETGSRNRVRDDVCRFAQVKERESGLRNRGKRNRSIQTSLKIFDDLREKLDLVRKIREFRNLSDSQSDVGQQANQLVQMSWCDPAGAVGNDGL